MHLFGKTNIRFLEVRNYYYLASSILIFAGILSVIFKGVTFGIDFLGGTEIVVAFDQPVPTSDIRTALGKVGLGNSEIKSYGEERNVLIRTTEQGTGTAIGDKIKSSLDKEFPSRTYTILKEDKIGPKIGKELRQGAIYAVIWSLIAILVYIAIRFKFIYGVGALLSLFHDVLVTLGIVSMLNGLIPGLNLEITQEVIAAFLTLVGASVNDTVVIFDRIRENEKIFRSMDLMSLMNRSLNETLSRTVITSGTILLVLVVLLMFGGEVNRAFAFVMTIGMITGTYSSIYIASATVLDWNNWRTGKKRS